ncbi:hypothetical protein L218DRAFT_885547, partial [Marasmius fiardii PR-910]
GDVALVLQRMHSVLHVQGVEDEITVYHASFLDFLHDQSRSGPFFIDMDDYFQQTLCSWLHLLYKPDVYKAFR